MSVTLIAGANFSGRTQRLRDWSGLEADKLPVGTAAYVGPDPLSALSGFAPTVRGEIDFAARDAETSKVAVSLLEELGFSYILDRNPFALSGGEQVAAAVAAALALRPERLAIDAALEQLAADVRDRLVQWLHESDTDVRIADNRQAEWYRGPVETLPAPADTPTVNVWDGLVPHVPRVLVEITGLDFTYPNGTRVFRDFSARLEPGIAYRLAGANGSGKSTLSKLLCGLLKPQRGTIRIDGQPVRPWRRPGDLASYHFQNPNFQIFARSVRDQLRRSAKPSATAMGFGLGNALETHPLDLPFVLRKRLALASAFTIKAALLVLDEPTLGQDDEAAQGIRVPAVKRAGVIISHSKIYEDLPTLAL